MTAEKERKGKLKINYFMALMGEGSMRKELRKEQTGDNRNTSPFPASDNLQNGLKADTPKVALSHASQDTPFPDNLKQCDSCKIKMSKLFPIYNDKTGGFDNLCQKCAMQIMRGGVRK
jgi:hypothetical protein